MIRRIFVVGTFLMFNLLMFSMLLFAQETRSQYSGEQHREIKSLSSAEIERYLKGEGMGLAKAAELNHYPGPRHVLDLASELKLSEEQRSKIEKIYNTMRERAIQLGKQIVQKERELDQLFKTESINGESLEKLVREIAVLQGELRLVHLQTHLVTKEVLTKEQIAKYDQLRGYTPKEKSQHNHHH
jgi:Spy/CpxP family protein refolding chaperone